LFRNVIVAPVSLEFGTDTPWGVDLPPVHPVSSWAVEFPSNNEQLPVTGPFLAPATLPGNATAKPTEPSIAAAAAKRTNDILRIVPPRGWLIIGAVFVAAAARVWGHTGYVNVNANPKIDTISDGDCYCSVTRRGKDLAGHRLH